MKKTVLIFSSLLLLASCAGNEKTTTAGDDVVSAVEAGGDNSAAYKKEMAELEKQNELEEKAALENVTTMSFDKEVHDFGKVKSGSENSCVFKVTNTGTKPLVIDRVSASCGCTTPKKPEKPIPPGKSDVIEVGFKPNGPNPDGKATEKTVTIEANTDPKVAVVKVRAIII